MEFNTLIARLQENVDGVKGRDYEAVVNSWVDDFRKDDRGVLHSASLGQPYQFVQFSNPRADSLVDTLNVITDRRAALPFWKEYQRLLVQESPYTVLYYPKRLAGVNRRLHYGEMDIRGDFVGARSWWLERKGPQ